jgi:hypothetical protein
MPQHGYGIFLVGKRFEISKLDMIMDMNKIITLGKDSSLTFVIKD